MTRLTLILILALSLGCTDADHTVDLLQANGFTEIETTGYKFFSCSQDDFYQTGFVATSRSGVEVEGTVCCGIFKSCTIRFD